MKSSKNHWLSYPLDNQNICLISNAVYAFSFYFAGGTLKIYAHTVFPEVPYKTLLVSVDDTCDEIIQESLEKFGKEKANPKDYVLVKVRIRPGKNTRVPACCYRDPVMNMHKCSNDPQAKKKKKRLLYHSYLSHFVHVLIHYGSNESNDSLGVFCVQRWI